jgi:AIPR protein.
MDEDKLNDYWQETITNVEATAENENAYPKVAFFELTKDLLIDANFFTDISETYYDRERGDVHFKAMHIDAGTIDQTDGSIHLMFVDYDRTEIRTITNEMADHAYHGLLNFLENCTKDFFRINNLQSLPVFSFVKQILQAIPTCDNIHLYYLSTNRRSTRIAPFDTDNIVIGNRTIRVQTHLLDIEYLFANEAQGQPAEPITISVCDYLPEGIECLSTKLKDAEYSAYLAVLPGQFLSQIYQQYGGRLLESNVRSFLSTRGNVNKGIRVTIRDNPELFFTYNNGIACTADEVTTELRHGSLFITEMKNFQIINGGQTTASLRNTQIADHANLDKVFVSMKLTVINKNVDSDNKQNMVRMISKYSNTQNKVTSSDLNSNSEFYVKLEQFSRRILAPNVGNNTFQTYWYFERSRGQYERDQMELTKAKRKQFQEIHPKDQRMRIVDIAKYYNSVALFPYDVVWGGQVNAERFQERIEDKWNADSTQFNELFFQNLVAEAILFNQTRDIIGNTEWYKQHSGILAELTAYTVSKLVYEVKALDKKSIDWPGIWKNQDLPAAMKAEILKLGEWVYKVLSDPSREKDNLGEWAKLERCWTHLSKLSYPLSDDTIKCLISTDEIKADQISAKKEQKRSDAVANGVTIFNLGVAFWENVMNVGLREGKLSGSDLEDIKSAVMSCKKGYLLPQGVVNRILAIRQRLEDEGLDVRIDKSF